MKFQCCECKNIIDDKKVIISNSSILGDMLGVNGQNNFFYCSEKCLKGADKK